VSPNTARWRLPAAIAVALVIGQLAVWLLQPSIDLDPASVDEGAYFSKAQIDRANDYRQTQRLLALAIVALQAALLVGLVARPPRKTIGAIERRAGGRRLVAGFVAGAGLIGALAVVAAPLTAIAYRRAVDFGLSTQGWGGWIVDILKSTAIEALLVGAAATMALALVRRWGRRWWIPGSALVVSLAVVFVWLAPVVLAPLFNRYTDLPSGRTRDDLIELAERNGVDVDRVLVVDASRRTNSVNAYVTGLGQTKRIVLYDTLLREYTPAQIRLVVAHELGHEKQKDVLRGLAWLALFTPLALYAAMLLAERWSRRAGAKPGELGSLPALALALAVMSVAGMIVSNQLSRDIEARADQFALEATMQPQRAIGLERRLTLSNLSQPRPPSLLHALLGTHPTPAQRIGSALAYERRSGRPAD